MAWNLGKAVNNISDYRYERKFFISGRTKHEVESLVKQHSAIFLEVYSPRFINNLYFDSFNMQNYFDNINGVKNRMKVRIRWYGNLFGMVEYPILEFKLKKGSLGTKIRYPLIPFLIDESFQYEIISDVFQDASISDALKSELALLNIPILNRYHRKYFRSIDKRYRLTIDSEMVFYQIKRHHNTFLQKSVDLTNTVLELKYRCEDDQHAKSVLHDFPIRMTKSSKYVNGIRNLW